MPLSVLVELLQGCEGALRSAGLQRSGDQLHHLLLDFLARQRCRSPLQGEQPPKATTQAPMRPSRRPRNRRSPRRVPGTNRWYGPQG